MVDVWPINLTELSLKLNKVIKPPKSWTLNFCSMNCSSQARWPVLLPIPLVSFLRLCWNMVNPNNVVWML